MHDCETAYAKVNLALHVRRREADGYHAIETLFVFAEDGDALSLTDTPGLAIRGPFAAGLSTGADNLVLRAAEEFARVTGKGQGAGFLLDKRLPVAAGVGGGSADAAAALRLLCRQHGVDPAEPRIAELAAGLGADVPACLLSRPVRGVGRGDRLEPAAAPRGTPLLLVNPRHPLSTAAVFAAWDGADRGPLPDDVAQGRNDLEAPAIGLLPVIRTILDALSAQPGVTLARMSGSGATCFALLVDDAARDAAVRALATDQPGWWLLPTRLR